MSKDTGGPAFPVNEILDATREVVINTPSDGMTLRDYFAAKAMQGMLAENGGGAMSNMHLAHFAYHLADAMIKEREK